MGESFSAGFEKKKTCVLIMLILTVLLEFWSLLLFLDQTYIQCRVKQRDPFDLLNLQR